MKNPELDNTGGSGSTACSSSMLEDDVMSLYSQKSSFSTCTAKIKNRLGYGTPATPLGKNKSNTMGRRSSMGEMSKKMARRMSFGQHSVSNHEELQDDEDYSAEEASLLGDIESYIDSPCPPPMKTLTFNNKSSSSKKKKSKQAQQEEQESATTNNAAASQSQSSMLRKMAKIAAITTPPEKMKRKKVARQLSMDNREKTPVSRSHSLDISQISKLKEVDLLSRFEQERQQGRRRKKPSRSKSQKTRQNSQTSSTKQSSSKASTSRNRSESRTRRSESRSKRRSRKNSIDSHRHSAPEIKLKSPICSSSRKTPRASKSMEDLKEELEPSSTPHVVRRGLTRKDSFLQLEISNSVIKNNNDNGNGGKVSSKRTPKQSRRKERSKSMGFNNKGNNNTSLLSAARERTNAAVAMERSNFSQNSSGSTMMTMMMEQEAEKLTDTPHVVERKLSRKDSFLQLEITPMA